MTPSRLAPEQRKVVRKIKTIGQQVGATPKQIKAALETGLVESGLRNLPGGDADSAGWRQERASLYKDPTNLDASIRRFYAETQAVRDKTGTAGDLAAAVQRPAAQYRGRYQGVSGQAQQLLGTTIAGQASTRAASIPATPGVDNTAARGQLINQFLNQRGGDQLDFAMGIRALQDTPGTPGTRASAPASSVTHGAGAQNALAWATEKIGNKETGPNSGGLASYANQRFGMANQPWCAMFTSLAVTKGGAPSSARTASVAQVLQKARAGQGYVKGFIPHDQAQPGDLVAFGTRHIGMVKSVDGHGRVTMIAGNDSNQVQERPVVLGRDAAIVRPAYGHR
jgi:hypothetical protein